jgi:RPA family protein
MAVDPEHVAKAASEMLARHGINAVARAQDRVNEVSRAGDRTALDLAMLLLTEVERQAAASAF